MVCGRVVACGRFAGRTVPLMAGRHRKPPAWQRLLRSALGDRAGVRGARAAALHAEVLGLRATVTALRRDLDLALARSSELAARFAADAAAPVEVVVRAAPPVLLELPLLRLALTRDAEPPLTREMAIALSAPDRGEDTARVEIVLADLPERSLLDPLTDRGTELRDLAAEIAAAPETVRRSA